MEPIRHSMELKDLRKDGKGQEAPISSRNEYARQWEIAFFLGFYTANSLKSSRIRLDTPVFRLSLQLTRHFTFVDAFPYSAHGFYC
jgi:hypothetical protein